MNLKKMLLLGLTLLSASTLTACVVPQKSTAPSSSTAESSSSASSEQLTDEERATKDAEIILTGVFTGEASGFNSVMGESVSEWRQSIIDDYVEEHDAEFDILDHPDYYMDPADTEYTIHYEEDKFTTDQVLEVYEETRLDVLASIGDDFTIDAVEIDGNQATVTFSSRGIALLDLANQIGTLKSMALGDIEASLEMGNTEDATLKAYNTLINDFLYYLIFDREKVVFESEVTYTSKREFTVILEEEDGNWVLTDDNFNELFSTMMVEEYSETGSSSGTTGA